MMTSLHPGGLPPQGETHAADSQTEASRLAAGLARTLKDTQKGRFYHGTRFAGKPEIASSLQHEIKHNHPLSKLKRRRRKPLILNRQVRRNPVPEAKGARADHGHRRHERFGKDGRHQGGGQGQSEGQEKERHKDGERRENPAPLVVKVGKAKRADAAAMTSSVLAAVQDPNLPPAQVEHDMRRAIAMRVLHIAKQLPADPSARVTAPMLGLSLDVNAALAFLHKRGISPNRTGLAGAKQVLLAAQDSAPNGAPAQIADPRARTLNLLAPLMVLGAEHPSTPGQLALARNRLRSRLAAVGTAAEHVGSEPKATGPAASQNL